MLPSYHFKQLDINALVVYGSVSGCSLFKLCKEGAFTNASKNLCSNVNILNFSTHDEENVNISVNDYIINTIDANIKQCRKIDELIKAGDLIKVIGYKSLKASMLIRCTINSTSIINDETQAKDYIATYWLKQLITKYLENNTKHINLMVEKFKTTP